MGLSRRQFTREFKLAAFQRLETGASVAEVARAFEVNPNVPHRWRREFREGPGNAFPGPGKRRWEEGRVALKRRKPGPGLVHHSDRGVQYASRDYTELLLEHGTRISMSRCGNPYDNALAETFIKTLKYEEVYRQEYRDLSEARASIERFLEKVYNEKRLHSALGYRPPSEFEHWLRVPGAAPSSLRIAPPAPESAI
jgi:hypothetical protein